MDEGQGPRPTAPPVSDQATPTRYLPYLPRDTLFPSWYTVQTGRLYSYCKPSHFNLLPYQISAMGLASDSLYFALHPNQLRMIVQWWVSTRIQNSCTRCMVGEAC